jgi:hypothetical protein
MKSLIGMDQRILVLFHLLDGSQYQFHGDARRQMPSDDLSGSNVFCYGKVGEAIVERQVGNICAEKSMRDGLAKGSVQSVGKGSMLRRLFHYRLVRILSPDLNAQPILSHDPAYLFMVHFDLFSPFQIHFNCSPAIFGFALIEYLFDQQIIAVVFIWFIGILEPPVISAPGCLRDGAQDLDIPFQRPDDPILLTRP